jgi:HSP20 family protein
VAAPGLKKEDFFIHLEKETLSISADVKQENEEKKPNYLKKEFSYQSFKRSFSMPENVNKDGIQASYENGVLKVSLPKMEKNEASSKTISVA